MTAKKSSTQIVLDALHDLHQQEQVVTRETLHELTGLKLAIIDDRIGALIEEGLAIRVQRGVFVPAEVHPPARVMSKTVLPDGTVKIDIGDQVLTLTPKEDRMLAALQAGVVMQAASIEIGRQTSALSGEFQQRLNRVERGITRALENGQEQAFKNAKDVTPDVTLEPMQITGRAPRGKSQTPGAKRVRKHRRLKKAAQSAPKT
tara:strand:+ start:502 stop:1113 length:612 start_codon:yes stop_codon:yes gene_type:complete